MFTEQTKPMKRSAPNHQNSAGEVCHLKAFAERSWLAWSSKRDETGGKCGEEADHYQ
jgi:hypothetical protein